VRQNYGRFRLCYENGLRMKPELTGNIVINFVIDTTGSADHVTPQRTPSELPDTNVVQCVMRGFSNLSFPSPTNGETHVSYTLLFDPAG